MLFYIKRMKATEKEVIYQLLKTASDNYYGYNSPEFSKKPVFTDDAETNKSLSIKEFNKSILNCSNCSLSLSRKNVIVGEGVDSPLVLVIGEYPTPDEDLTGNTFEGECSTLLDKMLIAIDLSKKTNCYITNIIKCKTKFNLDPTEEELASCLKILDEQINILKPKLILLLGRTPCQAILKTRESLGNIRGKFFEYKKIPVMASYHPKALIENTQLKKPAWQDLKLVKSKLLEIEKTQ